MMQLSSLLALAGLATVAISTPLSPPSHVQHSRQAPTNTTSSPCAQVSQTLYPNSTTAVGNVPADVAWACIQSVPLNATSAKLLLKDLPTWLQWQSTLTVLKNPPAEYAQKIQPPVDILGGLESIAKDIDAGKYSSEYEFGWSLYTLIQSAHDGHFSYIPDSVGTVFQWGRPVPLVSVSEDGQKLPSVFAYTDVLGMQFKNISYTPSPVVQIDGSDVNTWLEKWSQFGSLQDRDALYNNVFYELAQVSLGSSGSGTGTFSGGGRGRFVYPGDKTTLKFANGTSYTMQNYARVTGSFRGIDSAEKLASRFFYFGSANGDAPETSAPATGAAPGYPAPVVAGPVHLINAFYIAAPGYEDVAVLQVPNFVGDSNAEVAFQKTTQDFLPKAAAAGKTKLIIDLQANGGGTILQGYDMFKQLFPTLDPYGANRFRGIEAVDLIGQAYSAIASQVPRSASSNATIKPFQASYFDYHQDMTVDGKPWSSWADKFGPVETNGDKYTKLSRWNLSDVLIQYNSGGINVTGYGPLANASQIAPFKAENIVLLTDGYCASTCTIFSELMTKQGGVKTIALGGRSNKNAIQAIGGVKGTNNFQWSFIQYSAQQALRYAPGDVLAKINNTVLRSHLSDISFQRAASTPGVNVRDGVSQNDTSGVALQFKYEEADCRLYYTPEMTVDATAIWKAAADARWGSTGKCVNKSGYGGARRSVHDATTRLSRRRIQVSEAVARKQIQAFENTFSLETECHMQGDGFMHP